MPTRRPHSLHGHLLGHLRAILLAALALGSSACGVKVTAKIEAPASPLPQNLDIAAFPPRPADAQDGHRFARSLRHADEQGRERAILRELTRGNLPESLRHLARVDFRAKTRSGAPRSVTLWVTKDYLAVGSDADFIRMPMTPITAQLVADAAGCVLPTARLVDIVYDQAAVKLAPRPFPPGPMMVRIEEFVRHNDAIEGQLRSAPSAGSGGAGIAGRGVVGGHKKDIVISNRLEERPHRVAIYGWHRSSGDPIQPLSVVHGDWYADYSHGVRLIGGTMLLDGQPRPVTEVLKDPELAPLISGEGVLVHTRYRAEEGPGRTKWWPEAPPAEDEKTPEETPSTTRRPVARR